MAHSENCPYCGSNAYIPEATEYVTGDDVTDTIWANKCRVCEQYSANHPDNGEQYELQDPTDPLSPEVVD